MVMLKFSIHIFKDIEIDWSRVQKKVIKNEDSIKNKRTYYKKIIDNKKPLIELKNVWKKYNNKWALQNIDLKINPGDRIGVIGANGSGKSTMSEIIGGIRKPSKGHVIKQKHLTIGLQFQESKYPIGISVMDMIKYYLKTFNISMTEKTLKDLLNTYQISGFENKFIEGLSGGQQQRLNILLSIIHDPDLVILDEVSTGLDIEVRAEIFNFLKINIVDKNKAMILVSHTMSEIEEFCQKYIYIHNGKFIDSGLVKDIVKKYGSVHNYAWKQFAINKKLDNEQKQKNDLEKLQLNTKSQSKLKQKELQNDNRWAVKTKHKHNKNLPLIQLMLKYYYKGFFVPFFLVVWPILILFLQGFAFKNIEGDAKTSVHLIIGSIAMVQAMSVGIFIIPQTILEFKNSVLLKRIGATNIKPVFFVSSVILVGFIFIFIAFLWTLLWAGIFFGSDYGWSDIALPKHILISIPFIVLMFISSISFGIMLASVFKSTTAFIAVSNTIFFPIAFLSGSFVPINLILASDVLRIFTYINPFKYVLDLFLNAWNSPIFQFDYTLWIFLTVSLSLIGIYITVAGLKLRWQK